MHGDMLSLGDGVAVSVEQSAGAVFAFLDVGGISGLDQHSPHFLCDGHEGISDYLQQDAVNLDTHDRFPPNQSKV